MGHILTLIAAVLPLVGLSYLAAFSEAQSYAYYAIILASCVALAHRLPRLLSATQLVILAAVVVLPPLCVAVQSSLLPTSELYHDSSTYLRAFGLSLAILLAMEIAALPPQQFRRVCQLSAVATLPLLLYGVSLGSQTLTINARLGGALSTAVWGEVALGAALLAVLSRSIYVLIPILLAAAPVIYFSQMRGAGGALLILVLVLAGFSSWRSRTIRTNAILAFASLAAIGFIFMDPIFEFASDALMINDPYRGLQAGFSGRFGNFAIGLEIFLSHPLFGVGPTHPQASYTHNGYLKVGAEFGLVLAGPLLAALIVALRRSLRAADPPVVACVIAYAAFIMTSPRYISFQVMPFIGVIAVALALVWPTERGATYGTSMDRR